MAFQLHFPGFPEIDSSGGVKSKGRSQLLVILQQKTGVEVAKLVGCSGEFISLVAGGRRKPQRWALRVAFERSLSIPCSDWDEPPSS